MPFAPQPKVPGDLIRSIDWNEAMTEVVRLEQDKLNTSGGNVSGQLAVGSAMTSGSNPALRVLHNGAYNWGNALSIDQTVAGNNDGPKIRFHKTMPTPKSWSAGIINGANAGQFVISEDTVGSFGTPRLVIAPGGNVGIGTPTPNEKLQIGDRWTFHDGGTKFIGYNVFWNGANDVRIVAGAASQLRFGADGSLAIRNIPTGAAGAVATGKDILFTDGGIRFNNNVAQRVTGDVRAGSNAVVVAGRWDELEIKGRVLDWTGSNLHIGYENDHSTHGIYIGNSKLRDVNIEGTTNLNIPGGSVFFGSSVRQMLNLWTTEYGIGVQSSTLYFRSHEQFVWYRRGTHNNASLNAGGGTNMMQLVWRPAQTILGITIPAQPAFTVNGMAFKPGGGSWADSSDKKLKKNIKALKGSLEKVLQLRGVTFEWKSPEQHGGLVGTQTGLIAQEVEKVIPEWIGHHPDGTKYIAIKGFEALMIECVKTLHEEIESLKKQLSK